VTKIGVRVRRVESGGRRCLQDAVNRGTFSEQIQSCQSGDRLPSDHSICEVTSISKTINSVSFIHGPPHEHSIDETPNSQNDLSWKLLFGNFDPYTGV